MKLGTLTIGEQVGELGVPQLSFFFFILNVSVPRHRIENLLERCIKKSTYFS